MKMASFGLCGAHDTHDRLRLQCYDEEGNVMFVFSRWLWLLGQQGSLGVDLEEQGDFSRRKGW